jgi:hypothetical protein
MVSKAPSLRIRSLVAASRLPDPCSWRVRRESNYKLLAGLVAALRPLGLATGQDGFNATSTPSTGAS